MGIYDLLEVLQTAEDEATAIAAIRQLARHLTNGAVLNLLCAFAVATENTTIREALITAFKAHADKVATRFVHFFNRSRSPKVRRWALINLGLLEYRAAPEAVLEGLLDTDKSVRMAAATNAGLYDDPAILSALEDFYEKHRLDLVKECLQQKFESVSREARSRSSERPSPLALTETII